MTTMDSVSAHTLDAPSRTIRPTLTRTIVALLALAAIALLVARTPRPAGLSPERDAASASHAVDDGRPLLLPER